MTPFKKIELYKAAFFIIFFVGCVSSQHATSTPSTLSSSLKSSEPLQKVILMGKVVDETIIFGNCPHKIVVNIINKNGERSKKSENLFMYGNVVPTIMNLPEESEVNFNDDKRINGFQTIVDENGYFYFCDYVSLDSSDSISYEFDNYLYMNKCDEESVSVGHKGVGMTVTLNDAEYDKNALKMYFAGINKHKDQDEKNKFPIKIVNTKVYDEYLSKKGFYCK